MVVREYRRGQNRSTGGECTARGKKKPEIGLADGEIGRLKASNQRKKPEIGLYDGGEISRLKASAVKHKGSSLCPV